MDARGASVDIGELSVVSGTASVAIGTYVLKSDNLSYLVRTISITLTHYV